MKKIGFACLLMLGSLAVVILGVDAYRNVQAEMASAQAKIDELQQVVSSTKEFFLGYTRYTDYLSASRKALSAQAKFVAASLTRDERQVQSVERSWLGLKTKGAVLVTYSAEYTFGFELGAADYAIAHENDEIVVTLNRPVLLTTPAVKNLHHEVLADSWFIDGKDVALTMDEAAGKRTEEQGRSMASDPAVIALCEKNLGAFLRDFLSKQPGVRVVPAIRVVYRAPKVGPV